MKKIVKKSETIYELLKDGWIKDSKSGLEWGKSSVKAMSFKYAEIFCAKNGGRLPTRTELETIQDLIKYNPCIDEIFKDAKSDYYWSNTRCTWNKDCLWCVSFGDGGVSDFLEGFYFFVRPVRASQ